MLILCISSGLYYPFNYYKTNLMPIKNPDKIGIYVSYWKKQFNNLNI